MILYSVSGVGSLFYSHATILAYATAIQEPALIPAFTGGEFRLKLKELSADLEILFLRVLMGCGIAYHGYGKVFGTKIDRFTEGVASMGFPLPGLIQWIASLSEFVGGICIVLGLFTRPSALLMFVTMALAAFIKHGDDPFKRKELALAYWRISGALMGLGATRFSLDYWIQKKPINNYKN
ncbi:MAG: putative oxidoreductase [Candidatus Omnitrophota bacterium]|jgi:putative oxidoreductase